MTGSGRGVGRAVAIALARAGYQLCLAARTREELETTRTLTGLTPAQSLIVLIDLAQEEAPEDLVETACEHFGQLDLIVNNAGWAPPRTPLMKLSTADQDRILATIARPDRALPACRDSDGVAETPAASSSMSPRSQPAGCHPAKRFMQRPRPD